MTLGKAYIVAARRSTVGRLGGLHRNRRVEDLASPVLLQTLDDARIEPADVDALILGNTTAGSNPARLVALLSGLPDTSVALTLDRNTLSGLEAIEDGIRRIAAGEADVVVAGGAESLSTAPWRLSKPRTLFHTPRFVGLAQADYDESGELASVESAEALAARHAIARNVQDEYTITSHIRATLARDARRLVREIVPLKSRPEETRDELVGEPDIEDMESFSPILGEGTVTSGNSSLPADAAAFVAIVSEPVYQKLGRPPALVRLAAASTGVAPSRDLEAPIAAARKLVEHRDAPALRDLDTIELGEGTAVQALAFKMELGLGDEILNPDGGQVALGLPLGASSAILAVRLFGRLARDEEARSDGRGMAVSGASGGQALAVAYQRV